MRRAAFGLVKALSGARKKIDHEPHEPHERDGASGEARSLKGKIGRLRRIRAKPVRGVRMVRGSLFLKAPSDLAPAGARG